MDKTVYTQVGINQTMATCPAVIFIAPDETVERPGVLAASDTELHITLEEGHHYCLPWEIVTFALGGIDGQHLVITGVTTDGTAVYVQTEFATFIAVATPAAESIINSKVLPMQPQWQQQKRRTAALWPMLTGFTLACVITVYLSWGYLLDLAVAQIPISWEVLLGEAAATQFLARHETVTTGADFAGLQTISKRLLSAYKDEGFKYELYLIKNTEANAFALPGGSMVVYSGLLQEAANAEEVAGVLAHEIQHVRNRHGLRRIVGNLGLMAAGSIFIGDLHGLFGIAREMALKLSLLAYDRDQEREADAKAVRLLVDLQIDPMPFADFFQRMHDNHGNLEQTLAYFSTHPASSERAEAIKNWRDDIAAGVSFRPLEVSFAQSKN